MRLKYVKLSNPVQSPEEESIGDYTARDTFKASEALSLEVDNGVLFIKGPYGTTVTPFMNVRQAMLIESEKPAAKARAK
jgi:hypothetical protein